MKAKKLLLTILVIVSALSAALFAVSCSAEVITNNDSSYSQNSGDSQQGQSDSATKYKYRIEEYYQNVDGSAYERIVKDMSADAGSSVTADVVHYDGFVHVIIDGSMETGVLDADNTLTLKVYYDRLPYEVKVESDQETDVSGSGIYLYGASASVSAAPVAGYIFKGWYDGETLVKTSREFAYEVKKDVTLKAKWEASNETQYTVRYYQQDKDDDVYNLVDTLDLTGVTDQVATADIKTYEHFTHVIKEESVESGVIAADNSLELAVYYDREVYTVTVQGGDNAVATVGSGSYRYGKTITVSATSVGGFDFINWMDGSSQVSEHLEFLYTVEKDVELKAKWYQQIFIGSVSQPLSLTEYYANRAEKPNDLRNEFAYNDNPYYVGDDNAFTMKPIVNFVNRALEPVSQPIGWGVDGWTYVITLKLYNESQSDYVSVDDISLYIDSIDYANCVIDFNANAIGQKLSLSIAPAGLMNWQKDAQKDYSTTFEISVIDGYNVTNALELIYINRIANGKVVDYETGYSGGKYNSGAAWTAFAQENGLDLSASHAAVILHNNVKVSKDTVPSVFLYSDDDEDVKETDNDYDKVKGTMKDRSTLFFRNLVANENFIIEGNYFTLSCEDFPLVVRPEGKQPNSEKFVSHSQIFKFNAAAEDYTSRVEIRNINLVGNAKKSSDTQLTGGLILIKTTNASLYAHNNISNQWFINYFPDESDKRTDIDYCRAYDSFNSILYLWGTSDVHISHCDFNGAGGPVMIIDHVYQDKSKSGDEFLYSGIASHVEITDSTMHSFVTGNEAWFVMNNVTSTASQIKALNANFDNQYYNRSYVVSGVTSGEEAAPQYLDLIAVFKSGSEEGISQAVNVTGYFEMNGATCPMDFGTYSEAAFAAKNRGYCSAEQQYLQAIISGAYPSAVFVSSESLRTPKAQYQFDGIGAYKPNVGLVYGDQTNLTPDDSLFKGDQIYLYYTGLGISVVLGYYDSGDTVDPTDIGSLIRER